jgi:putative colanic acid biosynthesis UDP-glucose lipid carrier transferase
MTPLLIVLVEFVLASHLSRLLASGKRARKAVIAGGDAIGRALAGKIAHLPKLGLVLEGIFDDRSVDRLGMDGGLPIIGKLNSLAAYVKCHEIDVIFFALPIRRVDRVTQILDELHDTTASIYFVPDVFVYELIQCRSVDIDGMPAVALCETPFYGFRGLAKRLSDIAIASAVLLFVSPLLLIIALVIKLSGSGSVIFKQRRYGLDGQEIIVYKFRTMKVSEDDQHVQQASPGDPRITPIGACLRRFSLDELPQFFNVLQGRMSVVGPRPHAVAHNEEYRKLIKGYMVRHKVRPGITGLAQISGLRGETRAVSQMRERIEADLDYLRNWSLALDFRIMARTLIDMLTDKSAY